MDKGTWGATHCPLVAKSGTRLKRLSSMTLGKFLTLITTHPPSCLLFLVTTKEIIQVLCRKLKLKKFKEIIKNRFYSTI